MRRRPLLRPVTPLVLVAAGLAALVGAPAPARAQEAWQDDPELDPELAAAAALDSRALVSEAGAQAAALRILGGGVEPVLPGLTVNEVRVARRPSVGDPVSGPVRAAFARDVGVTIDHAGRLDTFHRLTAQYSFFGVPRPAGGWTDEALERHFRAPGHLDEGRAVEAARRFLTDVHPPFVERRWTLDAARPRPRFMEWFVVFREQPAPGVLACYPNRIHLYINAATGLVSAAYVYDIRATVVAPPPLDAAAARAAALREFPRMEIAHVCLTMLLKRRQPRAVWQVVDPQGGYCVVDAVDGTLHEPVED